MEDVAGLTILNNSKRRRRARLNVKQKGNGSVIVRGGKLWVDFYYRGERVRESSGLDDTPANRDQTRKRLNTIMTTIEAGTLDFGKCFPNSRKKDHFNLLEGRARRSDPESILFWSVL